MLIADVEAQGVWAIDGGISALVQALERLARAKGVRFRYGQPITRIEVANRRISAVQLASGEQLATSRVIFNGDPAALAAGLLGSGIARASRKVPPKARSLSALVWLL